MDFVRRKPFDEALWRNPPEGDTSYRERMLPDLLRKHKLVGMNYSQVTDLLGPPAGTSLFGPSNIEYMLGPHALDYDWLVMELDASKIVTRHWIDHD